MKSVICRFDLFDLHQDICVMDENGEVSKVATTTMPHLAEDILDVCEVKNINRIHLIGSEEYANARIIPEIRKSNTKFENNNLIIEVN